MLLCFNIVNRDVTLLSMAFIDVSVEEKVQIIECRSKQNIYSVVM